MVVGKILVLLFFIAVAFSAFDGDHFSDFAPNGFDGIEEAAALIFFLIATVLYILVAVAAVGALPADQLAGQDAPLSVALSEGAAFVPLTEIAELVNIGTLFAFFLVTSR